METLPQEIRFSDASRHEPYPASEIPPHAVQAEFGVLDEDPELTRPDSVTPQDQNNVN